MVQTGICCRLCKSCLQSGLVMFETGLGCEADPGKSIEQYEVAASGGIAEAMNNLGNLYHQGKGIKADPQEAFKWYTHADDAGYIVWVPYNLGGHVVLWRNGRKNLQKAYFYFKKAADKNYPQAQYILAGMMLYGEGVEENKKAAMELFRKSVENGFAAS